MNIYTYQVNVTTAGTPVQGPDQSVDPGQTIAIKAKRANTGTISIAGNEADADKDSTAHFKLAANESVELKISDLNQIWIDSTVSGEGVEIFVG